MKNWLDLSFQATHVMNFIVFNNIFLIIFIIYFSTNIILNGTIKKKLLKQIKGPTKKKHICLLSEFVKPINRINRANTSNL